MRCGSSDEKCDAATGQKNPASGLGPNTRAWPADEVDAWLDAREAERDDVEASVAARAHERDDIDADGNDAEGEDDDDADAEAA